MMYAPCSVRWVLQPEKLWFTSDIHFGHKNIIQYSERQFSDTWEMNLAICHNWKRSVEKDHEVVFLGDLSFMKFEPTLELIRDLPGKVYWVLGNHDNPKMAVRLCVETGWTIIPHGTKFHARNLEKFILSHKPMIQLPHGKMWNLCGHVHEKWKVKGRSINVGVDQWGMKPVNLSQIQSLIEGIE